VNFNQPNPPLTLLSDVTSAAVACEAIEWSVYLRCRDLCRRQRARHLQLLTSTITAEVSNLTP